MVKQVTCISDLLETIRSVRAEDSGAIWYRGQTNENWKLLPGRLRQQNKMSETSLLSRFKQSVAMLTSSKPNNSFDWIFLMQHYGVPTRLLDWSENPLAALYFAVTKVDIESDGAFWMLRPNKLNKNANISDRDEADYIPSFDDEEVQGYSPEQLRSNTRISLFPIATIATRNNPRIQAQSGTFTIHHRDSLAIEDVGNGSHCRKYLIPHDAKKNIREELSILGVNKFLLFPEMESISVTLRESM